MNTETTTGRAPISRWSLLGLGALLFAVSTVQTWWADRYDNRLGDSVAALAAPGDIRMLSSETCAICQLARQWLAEHQVPFSECMVERDPVCRADHEATGAPGTPVFLVRGQTQVGFSAEALKQALERAPPPGGSPLKNL